MWVVAGMVFTVVWEGLDGVGKTTLMAETMKFLEDMGYKVISYKTPSETPTGEFARRVGNMESTDPLTRMLLFLANTSADSHIMRDMVVREQADILFIDRYYLCSLVYGLSLIAGRQGVPSSSQPLLEWIDLLERTGRNIFIKPDLYIIVTVDEMTRVRWVSSKTEGDDMRYALDGSLQRGVLELYRVYGGLAGDRVIWVENRENLLLENARATAEKILEKMVGGLEGLHSGRHK